MITFGPIFQLQLYGSICPCLQKSEDSNARVAVKSINTAGKRIQWIRENSNVASTSGGFLGGIFAKATAVATNVTNSSNGKNCVASIVLQDNANDGQPELFVSPLLEKREFDEGDELPLQDQSTGYKLNLKLRRVDKVSLDGASGEIILFAKSITRDGKKHPAKELLRFVVLMEDKSSPITQDERNSVVHHLMVISEWERQRRAALSAEDLYESDEDEDAPNFLVRRAQKASHFANREIEMQQTKRDRENRKAKLIKEAGGLKYTAMAMANRES